MEKELKSCPFCGGNPKLIAVGDNKDYYVYSCTICGYKAASFNEAKLTKRGARKIWNRRYQDERQ